MEHQFTATILDILRAHFGDEAPAIYERSELLQYLNIKTRSASRGSKSRSSFANLYALYVLVEDYLAGSYAGSAVYADYEGAAFSDLFRRQRELPFGSKLQNHALNHRLNEGSSTVSSRRATTPRSSTTLRPAATGSTSGCSR